MNWGARIRRFLGSSVFRRTSSCVLGLTAYTAAGNFLQDYYQNDILLPAGGQALFGAALSVLLVLRTNSAYDRWWEGRKLWGQLTNECRNLAVKLRVMADVEPAELALARRWLAAFPACLRDHLRQGVSDETLSRLPEPVAEGQSHVPGFVSSRLLALVRRWRDQGKLHRLDHHLIDRHISALLDICGGCERIRNTPLPLSHRALIPQLLVVYLVLAPVGMDTNPWNLVLVAGVGYFLIGLELVAEDIEEPFGLDLDDLPLDRLCDNIGRFASETLPEPGA